MYPPFETLNISPLLKLRPPIQRHHFVLDTHLGRLARYLRLLGFDSLYGQFAEDKDLARNSHEQQRILLTRDRGLLKRSEVVYGYYVRSTKVREQLNEIVDRFHLKAQVAPFSRCLECNTSLQSVAKDRILEQLQARTRQHFDEFLRCPSCNRIYWAGSHHKRMSEIVTSILSSE